MSPTAYVSEINNGLFIHECFNVFYFSRLYSKKNWRESSPLSLWIPGWPAFDFHEKTRLSQKLMLDVGTRGHQVQQDHSLVFLFIYFLEQLSLIQCCKVTWYRTLQILVHEILSEKQPVYCIKAWNVSIHYFSKLFPIKLFIFSKLLQYTNYVSKNNVINAAKRQKDHRVFNLKTKIDCVDLVSLIWVLQIWVVISVYGTMINWSSFKLIKKLMQMYIVIVSGSILNVSTVHLNGIWHLI